MQVCEVWGWGKTPTGAQNRSAARDAHVVATGLSWGTSFIPNTHYRSPCLATLSQLRASVVSLIWGIVSGTTPQAGRALWLVRYVNLRLGCYGGRPG